MDTRELFYHIYQKSVTAEKHYLPWALSMLEHEQDSLSLSILASLRPPYNLFEIEDYFHRTLKELSLPEPSEQERTDYLIYMRLQTIVQHEEMALTEANHLYTMFIELDCPTELVSWLEISDMIDDYQYGDNYFNITDEIIHITIMKEAKSQLEHYRKKIFK
ncbi:hypothetical protein AB3N02_14335 [Priestia aryabhattai]|uniref:hypothetical protein n=1 Tax=Priestia aryabhattai TaxID=412384 RepID=UPI0039A06EF4